MSPFNWISTVNLKLTIDYGIHQECKIMRIQLIMITEASQKSQEWPDKLPEGLQKLPECLIYTHPPEVERLHEGLQYV